MHVLWGKKKRERDLDGVTLPAEVPRHPDVRKGKRRLPAVRQESLQYPQTAGCSLRCGVLENGRGTHLRCATSVIAKAEGKVEVNATKKRQACKDEKGEEQAEESVEGCREMGSRVG